jgi:uncharacterized membrane protein/membrane-bound inhibitor of C-type lysozyme
MIHSTWLVVGLLSGILLVSGCARPEVSALITNFPTKEYRSTYTCPDGSIFTVESDGNQAHLGFGERYWTLQRTVSASGEKYQAGRILYWSRGESALFEVDDKLFLDCSGSNLSKPRQQARQSGVLIRAVGQEPGWIVEISPAGTLLVTDYGQNRQELPEPVVTPGAVGESDRYQIKGQSQRIELVITKTSCQDSMSGEIFPAQALLIMDDQNFNGCADMFP